LTEICILRDYLTSVLAAIERWRNFLRLNRQRKKCNFFFALLIWFSHNAETFN